MQLQDATRRRLEAIVDEIGHLLPAQGPIDVFVHHNTLHAFEHLPFEQAVVEAAALFGCEPFLDEERYRQELRGGRIDDDDVAAVLATDLGTAADEVVIGTLTRGELRRRILLAGIPARSGPDLRWTLEETDVLRRLRPDVPADWHAEPVLVLRNDDRAHAQARHVRALWDQCRAAIERVQSPPSPARAPATRLADALRHDLGVDIDAWVHPILVRTTSAFLDQGLADWTLPARDRGLLRCFLDLYAHPLTRHGSPIGRDLHDLLGAAIERVDADDPFATLHDCLTALDVPPPDWHPYLLAEALALRGFAGMVHQFERRPDRAPTTPVPARLVDFLAMRLLLVRAAVARVSRDAGLRGSAGELRRWLDANRVPPAPPSIDDRAWPLFHVAQLCGLGPEALGALPSERVRALQQELVDFDGIARRRLLHAAYERNLRHRFLDALSQHVPHRRPPAAYQAVFCIDDREESMRRHLEEVDPDVETFGIAGYFGVAMYYRGVGDARARPLCPVAIRPGHLVTETPTARADGLGGRWRRFRRSLERLVHDNVHVGGRRARVGAALFATIGLLWIVPLVVRVVFPWFRAGTSRLERRATGTGRLALERADFETTGADISDGFTVEQMADIVQGQLAPIGIADRLSPLVLLLGHGSAGLNNPHRSAYDCGACGGGHGGPNARAFAQMANHPGVRGQLRDRGLAIEPTTWFVGGERNTSSSAVTLFDLDLVPQAHRAVVERAQRSLEQARRLEAHERCRRFESAGTWLPPAVALMHVEARALDLAQPRPECGHATNALCVVGRRERTRGLFLDRRAFLVSYDPSVDTDGVRLAGLLRAVVPVVAGINLEYLFSYVDNLGYGAGTKLPHNVTGRVGVMDGAESDLRTGLPWQMVEIHEPVRLSLVVEAETRVVQRLLAGDETLRRLVEQRWLFLATLDPSSATVHAVDHEGAHPYLPKRPLSRVEGPSRTHYDGHRGHLPFVALGPTEEDAA